jgi:hypothetical protein
VPRLCIVYPGICLTNEENHGKPQSDYPKGARLNSAERDSFRRLGHCRRRPRLTCYPCSPWFSLQATGQSWFILRTCRVAVPGLSKSAKLESKLSVRALMWTANSGTPRSSFICLLLTYTSSRAKTLGLQHLQLPDMGAGCGSSCGARVIHHGTDSRTRS